MTIWKLRSAGIFTAEADIRVVLCLLLGPHQLPDGRFGSCLATVQFIHPRLNNYYPALGRSAGSRQPTLPCSGPLATFLFSSGVSHRATIKHWDSAHGADAPHSHESAHSLTHASTHTHPRVNTCPQSSLTFVRGVDDGEGRGSAGQQKV